MKMLLPQDDPNSSARAKALADAKAIWTATPVPDLGGVPFMGTVPPTEDPPRSWYLKVVATKAAILQNRGKLLLTLGVTPWRAPAAVVAGPALPISASARGALPAVARASQDPATANFWGSPLPIPIPAPGFPHPIPFPIPTSTTSMAALHAEANDLFEEIFAGTAADSLPLVASPFSLFHRTWKDYEKLFATIADPPVVALWNADADAYFAELRVAGPNPETLEKVRTSLHPDWSPHANACDGSIKAHDPTDSLAKATAEGRVFEADYTASLLAKRPPETVWGIKRQRHVVSPRALFLESTTTKRLVPVAITYRHPTTGSSVAFVPGDPSWAHARTIAQVADANHHELSSHLARTHLVMELAAVATHATLAANHPLHVLLARHCMGTVSINHRARNDLIAKDGAVDRIFAGTIASSLDEVERALGTFQFAKSLVPLRFAAKGTDSLAYYPFRDAALELWNAIHAWVKDYLDHAYKSPGAFGNDFELAAWSAALAAPLTQGGIPGFVAPTSLLELVDAVTLLVFTGSVQHAAVNYPQWTDMSFAPAFAGATWSDPPDSSSLGTAASHLDQMPPPPVALAQLEALYTLGNIREGILGDYAPFGDVHVDNLLVPKFKAALKTVEASIATRNVGATYPYETLLPSTIPGSVNI